MVELPKELTPAFPKRPVDCHKYSVGTVTVVGGSPHFVHAPVLAALGARAAGAGLVQLVVPDASRIAAGVHVPEATFTKLTPICVPPKADVTAIGMGLGVTQTSEMLLSRLLSGSKGCFVLDADALTIYAHWYARTPDVPAVPDRIVVMTPHAGEAARLLGWTKEKVAANRLEAVKALAKRYRAVAVLKGPGTLVAQPGEESVWTCPAGNPFMACGGMGDVLAGVIAARWAYALKQSPKADGFRTAALAAQSGVWLHAAAADGLVNRDEPEDPSVTNVAHAVARLRVRLEKPEA